MNDSVGISFSNRLWGLKIGLGLALLVGMGAYSGIVGSNLYPAFADFLKDPDRYDGTRFMVQFVILKGYDGPGKFRIVDLRGRMIQVLGDIPPGQEGCFMSFEGTFKSPGYLILGKRWHIYKHDTLKLIVSAPALLGVGLFFLGRFRFNLRRFRFEDMHSA